VFKGEGGGGIGELSFYSVNTLNYEVMHKKQERIFFV